MTVERVIKAALLGFAITAAAAPMAGAQSLTVQEGATSAPLQVPVNRAVVVEADQPFAEISIANPGIADISTLSDRSIYVLGKAPGRTTMVLFSPEGALITSVEVQVTPDVGEFKERLRQILPGEAIEVRTANDGIVLSGVVSTIEKLDRALDLANRYAPDRVSNLMMVGGNHQVMLKVRFAEMQRSVRKSLSSSLAVSGTLFDGDVGTNAGNGVFSDGSNVNAIFDGDPGTIATSSNETTGSAIFGFSTGSLQLAILLEALESKNMVRTLSEPNLVALSGQEASFLAGGEYPVPVVDGDGGISIDYKPFGVELTFIPRVIDAHRINLELNAAVSGIDPDVQIQNGGFAVNAFRRRATQTTVEMGDGESFAIAGLLQDDFNDVASQVPWISDIPILGALFRSAAYQREQSELVIIVTPHLVSPVKGHALALPTDRIRPPTESELFLYGRTVSNPNSPAAEVAKQDFSGSYGYVME